MGVEVRWVGNTIVDEKGQRTIFRDTLFNLIKINNNWYLAGMESDSCQKQFIQL
jgi:hypothetical protein